MLKGFQTHDFCIRYSLLDHLSRLSLRLTQFQLGKLTTFPTEYGENYNYNMTPLHSIALPPLPSFRMIPSFYRWLTTLEENSKKFIIDGGTQPISMATYL